MISYIHTSERITADQLREFFDGWPQPPSPETHLRLLANSDEESGNVVGFVTVITDRGRARILVC